MRIKLLIAAFAISIAAGCANVSEDQASDEENTSSFSIAVDADPVTNEISGPPGTEEALRCTKVYRACGTCGDGGIVEWYCDGGGTGSEPDFTTCEACLSDDDSEEIKMSKAPRCVGNACDDITINFRSGCFYVRNYAPRRVRVKLGHVAKTLQRDETWQVVIFGQCLQAYRSPAEANYQ